jgi:DNA-binding FadR family transcriptional regulator
MDDRSNRGPERGTPDGRALRPATLTGVRPAQRRRLTEEVADHLLEVIAGADDQEMTLPIERDLCEQLGVSRNVLREALSALDRQGVLQRRGKARVGISARARAQLVAGVPRKGGARGEALDPIELRLIVEPEAAALAAARATEDDVQQLEHWLEAMVDAAAGGESVVGYDSAFHVAIARATRNDMLADLVSALADAVRPSRELSFQPAHALQQAVEDHREILRAIVAQDPRAAREATRLHLHHIADLIRSTAAPA